MNIDPNLLSIILGLITNSLTSLIAVSGKKAGQLLIGKEFQEKWELEKTTLEPLLQAAIKSIAENVEWKGPAREEVVALFLLSPEAEEIVRQIYSTRFTRSKKQDNLPSIRQIFLTSFTQFIASYPSSKMVREDQLAESATILLDTLIKECDLILESATDKGILAAHEAKSALRHHIIGSEIQAIQKKLDFLLEKQKIDFQAILDFEKKYRAQVGSSHSNITPPNFDSAHQLSIDELFVPPRFYTIPKKKEDPQVLTMDSFLSSSYRAVLLGNPGGGKSTFSLKLCHDLATQYPHLTFAGRRQLTPILVILREYGADKKDRNCSILEFIEVEVKATYQLTTPPPHTFEYLLLSGRAMVIFDGLDELLDTSYRQEIRNDVEAFCRLYPSVPVLVTSREVGYEQAPLDKTMFEAFRLADFNEVQIQEYVKKWFNAEEKEATKKLRQVKVEAFLKESKIVPDLRSNPLMLALLCNIYRGENYIPRNRPEVYDKCAIMLFERWDKSRKLYAPPIQEEHMRPLMEYLAQWIFEDEILRKGVTEEELSTKATDYLYEWVFENVNKAERVAHEFIKFCTGGRAWVFLDTGTKKEGEKLYQFAHATFLEYFTAAYYVGKYRTPDALIRVLRPRIAKGEWDVMAQLAFQLQSKRMPGAGDELLTALITLYDQEKNHELNLLSFAVRCLNFITPRPKVVRSIATICIEYTLTKGINKRESNELIESSHDIGIRKIFNDSRNALSNNYEIITDTFEKQLVECINMERDAESLSAWEIFIYLFAVPPLDEEKLDVWASMRDHVLDSCTKRLKELSPRHFEVCHDATRLGIVKVSDFIKWHGINSLFLRRELPLFSAMLTTLYIDFLSLVLISTPSYNREHRMFIGTLNNIKEMGHILLTTPLPCFKHRSISSQEPIRLYFDNPPTVDEIIEVLQSVDSDVWFGIIALIAIIMELKNPDMFINLEKESHPLFKFIGQILLAHFRQVPSDRVQAELDKCRLSSKQQNFVWQWVRGEINLVQRKTARVVRD